MEGMPFLQELSDKYFELHPEAFKSQFDRIKLSPSYQIADTPFSTVTINRNFRTGLHKDAGDYGGVAVMSVLERGEYNGGVLMMPRYGIGIDIRQGDVLVADVHQWHCNTELWTTEEQDENNAKLEPYFTNDKNKMTKGSEYYFDRISFVCYLREKMINCPTESGVIDDIKPKVNYVKYVIPSYQRCNELKEQTLSYLTKNNIKNKDIYFL